MKVAFFSLLPVLIDGLCMKRTAPSVCCPKAAADLSLYLEHAQVPLGLVVGKRYREVLKEELATIFVLV